MLSNFQTSETPQLVIAAPLAPVPARWAAVAAAPADRLALPRCCGARCTARGAVQADDPTGLRRRHQYRRSCLHAVIAVESGYDAKGRVAQGLPGG